MAHVQIPSIVLKLSLLVIFLLQDFTQGHFFGHLVTSLPFSLEWLLSLHLFLMLTVLKSAGQFCRTSLDLGLFDVVLPSDSGYVFFSRNIIEAMLCPSQCIISGGT